jgi:prepilin-type N-terminal cleavage/methylation domain-containing protein
MNFRFSILDSRLGRAGAGGPFTRQSKIENPKSKISPRSKVQSPESDLSVRNSKGFTLLEVLLSLGLVGLLLVALNTFVFSMGELWGQRTDVRLFDQHVRAVTRFLDQELRAAGWPPAARVNSSPFGIEEIRPENSSAEKLLTFELPSGSRLLTWPERPLPEVVCSLQARPTEGLVLLWHSRLETNFDVDPPRETLISPMVTALAYDYYEPDFNRWTTETALKLDPQNQNAPITPQRLRLSFTYGALKRETVVTLPTPVEGLPLY